MDKLRLGVLGCSGHYALRVAAPLKSSLIIEPYALASRNEAKGREYARKTGFSKVYGSYEALLADPDVDFVYIPLPNNLHLEYIKKAADAHKPIICEKPICLNAKEAAEAAAYCKSRNVPVMEAFMYRFHPQWVRVKELADIGEIGEILTVHGLFSFTNKDPGNIRNSAGTGGGGIYDIGCYTVSSARYLFGKEPLRVVCTLKQDPQFKIDILASALLDFGEGKTAAFTVSTQMFQYQQVTAVGTGGSIFLEIPFNMYGDVPARVTVKGGLGQRIIETEIVDQYLLEFDAFAESIMHKTETPTPVSDAICNMAVLDALFKSAESGNWETVQKY